MKKYFLIVSLSIFSLVAFSQKVLVSSNSVVSFFSSTPLEDISAKTTKTSSAINADTKVIYFKIPNTSFEFKNNLMKEHFNENYMESDKFPFSEFKGNYTGDVNFAKDGTYNIVVKGKMTIHGVSKEYTTPGVFIVKGGNINGTASFNIAMKDHNIDIPTIVAQKIAEKVQVKVNINYVPKK